MYCTYVFLSHYIVLYVSCVSLYTFNTIYMHVSNKPNSRLISSFKTSLDLRTFNAQHVLWTCSMSRSPDIALRSGPSGSSYGWPREPSSDGWIKKPCDGHGKIPSRWKPSVGIFQDDFLEDRRGKPSRVILKYSWAKCWFCRFCLRFTHLWYHLLFLWALKKPSRRNVSPLWFVVIAQSLGFN